MLQYHGEQRVGGNISQLTDRTLLAQISLGEMIAYLPIPGGHITLAERFVDPAFSFTMGWNYWYNWTMILPAELSAAAVLMNFWNKVSPRWFVVRCNYGNGLLRCCVFLAMTLTWNPRARRTRETCIISSDLHGCAGCRL
jgi:hypothetical protein